MGHRRHDTVACIVGQYIKYQDVSEASVALRAFITLGAEAEETEIVLVNGFARLTQINDLDPSRMVLRDYSLNCFQRFGSFSQPINFKFQRGLVFCNRCTYRRPFAGDYYLKHHIQSYHDQIPYHCKEPGCREVFDTKVTLNKHRRQNHKNDETVIYCPECGYRSLSAGEHDRHLQRMHKEKNEYKCDIQGCNRKYSRRDHYEVHLKQWHNIKERKVFPCVAHCNKSYVSKEKRDIHVGKAHPELIVRCRYRCGDEFEFQAKLDEHYHRMQNQSNAFVCEGCERRFVDRDLENNIEEKYVLQIEEW
ncbi:unnamed protein product [Mucor hiemalis]